MIITLTGPNNFMIRSELNSLVADFVEQYGDMSLEKIDCEDAEFDRITSSLQALPFLTPKRLVVLYSPSANKQFKEDFEKLVSTVPDTSTVILVEPKPDKRSAYYKQLKKLTQFKEFSQLESSKLASWLSESAKQRGGQISTSDARYLIERVGDNQQLLSNELDKLLAYEPQITRKNIDTLTDPAPQGSVFQLLDAAFAGNQNKVLELYKDQRAQKVEPLAILAMIAWQLHVLAVVKVAGDRNASEIAREAGLSPFVVQKTMRVATRLSLTEVKRLVRELHEIDIKLKSTSIDADEALQNYLINI